jgi:hypothetical protein
MYLSGKGPSSSECEIFLAKYNLPEGNRDSDFGVNGMLCLSESTGFIGRINSIVYEGNNNTLTAFGDYEHPEGDRDIFAFRLNGTNGIADNSFGINGWSTLRVPASNEYLASALIQPDRKYCFGGHTDYNENKDFLIGRVNTDGFLDTSFGDNGLVTTEIYAGRDNQVKTISLSPDCDLLYAAGSTSTPNEYSMAVAAYHTGFETGTGLRAAENSGPVKIFPNPVRDQISIHFGQAGLHHVRIFDVLGKAVLHQEHQGENAALNLEFLPAGVYFIQFTLADKQVATYKLLKK